MRVAGSDGPDDARWRVFLSHTSELRNFPEKGSYVAEAERAIAAAGHVIVDMADFPAADQPAAPYRQVGAAAAGSGHYAWIRSAARFSRFAWDISWDDAPHNPSAAGAVSAMTCAIHAASILSARGRTSCKRQVVDSDPGGSQQARLASF